MSDECLKGARGESVIFFHCENEIPEAGLRESEVEVIFSSSLCFSQSSDYHVGFAVFEIDASEKIRVVGRWYEGRSVLKTHIRVDN